MIEEQLEAAKDKFDAENQMDSAQDTFESLQKALESLEKAFDEQDTNNPDNAPQMALHLNSALECLGIGLEAEQNGFKAVINKIVATIIKAFELIIDYFKNNSSKASKYVDVCNNIVSGLNALPTHSRLEGKIENVTTLMLLSLEGNTPRFLPRELENLFADSVKSRKYSPMPEIKGFIQAISKDTNSAEAFKSFHAKLLSGLESLGVAQSPTSKELFNTLDASHPIYSSKRLLGDRFVYGQITPITDNDRFEYTCQVRRDPQTKLRVNSLPVLSVNDISLIVRIVRTHCEDLIRNRSIEADYYSILRDVKSLIRSNPTRKDVTALRTIVYASQSLYLVNTRYCMMVCEATLYYVRDSLKQHLTHLKAEHAK